MEPSTKPSQEQEQTYRFESEDELSSEEEALEDARTWTKLDLKERQALLELERQKHELEVRKFEWEKVQREKEYQLKEKEFLMKKKEYMMKIKQMEFEEMKLDLMERELSKNTKN